MEKGGFVEKAISQAKNPLGIIGLFLVLVEAIAAIVIMNSKLNDSQNLILVLFIVLFPCMVLGTFYILVTRHHKKLYSPSDYKDEKNFVSTYDSSTQSEVLIEQSEQKNDCNSSQSRAGMDLEDIRFIKQTLNSIVDLQKSLAVQKGEVSLVEDRQRRIDENWDAFLTEKEKKNYKDYKVEISRLKESNELVSQLQNKGYNADIYDAPRESVENMGDYRDHEAIWLGCKVPYKVAVDVIKTAKSIFPHLKYIHLSDTSNGAPDFVENEVYIGGATSTALEYRLKELSQADFEELYNINNQSKLHSFIKRFY